jgi:hypothetical protein
MVAAMNFDNLVAVLTVAAAVPLILLFLAGLEIDVRHFRGLAPAWPD